MRPVGFLLILSLPSAFLSAQVYNPPEAKSSSSSSVDTSSSSRGSNDDADSPYGNEIPLLDPGAETVTIAGVTIPLGNSRVVKARFEKYLNEPPEDSEAAQLYRSYITDVLELLSPMNHATFSGRRNSTPSLAQAFSLLPKAATYPGDARLSSTLAESVYTAMLAKKDSENLREINKRLQSEKKRTIGAADSKVRNNRPANTQKRTTKVGANETVDKVSLGNGMASLEYAEYLRRIAEIEALKGTNTARSEASLLASKAQFQSSMIQWFFQRRFQHVLMASRFYNQIWRDGDSRLKLEEGSEAAEMFSGTFGTIPTVSTMDSLASEAIRDTEKAVSAFEYLLARGEIHNASQRLMEAFAVGEYLTPVATLALDKKRQVQTYVTELNLLSDAMNVRDYGRARELTKSLKEKASDFPSAKADAAIAGYTLSSDLAIQEAKASLLANNREKAAEAIRQATELWPTNPKLQEFSAMMGGASELMVSQNSFDRLLSESNYREIAKRAREGEFILATRGDEERTAALNEIVDNLQEIDGAIAKASEFSRMGATYNAYEQLARIRKQFPDDPKLGREIELLAPQVADFTKALMDGEQLLNRREPQIGSAMANFLKAQAIFPDSEIAKENIELILEDILP